MAIVSAGEMLRKASKEGYAVGAFNITSLVQMAAVIEAANDLSAPVIVQTSVTPAKFFKPEVLAAAFYAMMEDVDIPVCLHLDHCEETGFCKRCADAGYTNIMFDGSQFDYEDNIRYTREVSDYCHNKGDITVEGELGTVSGVEDQVEVAENEAQLCNPRMALDFVARSGIDIFGPAIGTAHGVYTTDNPVIDFDRLGRINDVINVPEVKVPLVIHGGTGLSEDTVRALISKGGAKYNVSTHLKHVLIDSSYNYLTENRTGYNPGKLDLFVKKETAKCIMGWIELLGSKGKAK
jgi:ketose-bisphosphate aldolase